jgi:hypothetical protein
MGGLADSADRTPAQRTTLAVARRTDRRRKLLILAHYVVVLGLLAVPILSVVVPPLVDYPNHLARMHILAAYNGSSALQANYVIAWKLSPYLAMDLIIPHLAYFMSIYTAGRVFLYLCLLLFVLGTAAVHAVLHGRLSPWPATSALFAYCYVTSLGFVNYLFGVGIWLLAFAGWIALSRGVVRWRIAGGTLLALAVFFCHFFAFFGYMLCVGAYELGVWLQSGERRFTGLLRRGIVAFCPFIPALAIFVIASSGQQGGDTWYGSPSYKFIALFSPVLFQGVPYNLGILLALLYLPLRKGLLGKVHLAPVMRMPLLAVGIAAMAMPNVLAGVWGVDFRLPIVFVFLLIASCSWSGVSKPAAMSVTAFLAALLTVNVGMIVWAWQPIGRQFDEFRLAMREIPRGARVIVFRDETGTDPALLHQPISIYDHLALLAVIETDAYVPFLMKNAMMPVAAAPRLRNIDTAVDNPIEFHELIEGMDPIKGPAMLGTLNNMGMINYWGDWPRHYDNAVELAFGARPELPPRLARVGSGTFFNIYRIIPPDK